MKTWIVSDWHLGESRFDIMMRPFTSVESHCNTIVNNHNKVVGLNDLVYVVGDVIYQKSDPNTYLSFVKKMNGNKILIRGNHDAPFSDEMFKPYFDTIIADGKGIEIDIGGIPCYITHYPSTGRNDKFNLVGHIHSAWKFQLNMLNVGVDVHNFYPVSFDKISFFYNDITEFYDKDVWAGYLEINEKFRNVRGKKSSYFDLIKSMSL